MAAVVTTRTTLILITTGSISIAFLSLLLPEPAFWPAALPSLRAPLHLDDAPQHQHHSAIIMMALIILTVTMIISTVLIMILFPFTRPSPGAYW